MSKTDIRSATPDELAELVKGLGAEKYRGKQIFEWINKKFVTDFDKMSNLPRSFIKMLGSHAYFSKIKPINILESAQDSAKKYLFELENNTIIESVSMKYTFGNSLCISSQAGCRMGCVFCASAKSGFGRNLTAGEMTAQVYEISRSLGERVSNIVIMGSGEPFDNYGNVIRFIRLINSTDGLNISQRHITVSTCGIVPGIYDFANEGLQVNLAVSLHAPGDEIRRRLMPIAKRYSVEDIITACKSYSNKTGRRVTYEYAMAAGINDSVKCASILGHKIKGTLSHVNLIPMNIIGDAPGYKHSGTKTVEEFAGVLAGLGIAVTIRRKLGSDINASCGQLRNRFIKDSLLN